MMIELHDLLGLEVPIDGPDQPCPGCGRPLAPVSAAAESMDVPPHCATCGVVLAG